MVAADGVRPKKVRPNGIRDVAIENGPCHRSVGVSCAFHKNDGYCSGQNVLNYDNSSGNQTRGLCNGEHRGSLATRQGMVLEALLRFS
jgi:hypothetical protein